MFAALPIEVVGNWWLPGNRRKARGKLVISKQGNTRLEFDDFTPPGWLPSDASIDPVTAVATVAVVYGEVAGRPVTLLDCQLKLSIAHQADVVIDGIADSVVYGTFVQSVRDEVFTSVHIELEHLTAWTATAILRDDPKSVATIIDAPQPVKAETESGSVSITWNVKREGAGTTAGTSRTLTEVTEFVVSPIGSLSAEAARTEARHYQDLITLAAGRSAGLLSVRLHGGRKERRRRLFNPGTADYFFPTVVKSGGAASPMVYQQMAFSLLDIEFEQFINRWRNAQEEFRGPLGALLGFRYSPEQYIENQVVLLVAAAEESYRASNLREDFISKSQVQKVRKLVRETLRETQFSQVAKDLSQKIDGRVTLDDRLTGLAEYLGAVDVVFGGAGNLRAWIDAAKSSRNKLAHTGGDPGVQILRLRAIALAAEALVELAIFKGLNFDDSHLLDIARKRHLHVGWWIERGIIANSNAT
jgi:hypothetical protein